MSEPSPPPREELEAQQAELRKTLDSLAAMAQQGLPVAEAQAQARQQLAELERQLVAAQGVQPATFDQQAQQVGTQYNIAFQVTDKADTAKARHEAARQRYLRRLRQQCQALPLAALGGEEGADEDLTLDHIYIDLDTTTRVPLTEAEKADRKKPESELDRLLGRQADDRPLSALEAAAQSPRLALLGDPGAGKSTFAHKLLVWLAAANLGETGPPPGLSTDLLPVLITLRDLAPRLASLDLASLPETRQRQALAGAVREQAVADLTRLEAEDFAEGLPETLAEGHCLLVLDGLDEVPHDLRRLVRRAVAAVLAHYRAERIILTCRVRSYVDEAVLPDFQAHTLAPFDRKKIEQFTQAWYTAQKEMGRVDAEQAQTKAENLTEAALSGDLRELAENPMLLTTMAIIHQREIGLPRERVRLYSLAVEVLLHRWQKRKTGQAGLSPSPALADFLKDNLRLRRVMERLAYEAHQAGQAGEKAADLSRGQALILLEQPEYLGQAGLAAEFLDYVDQRSGLLVGRGGQLARPTLYSFPHRTFQEYLAGGYMISRRDATREFYARAGEGDYWAVAAQLGAEELLHNLRRPNELLDLMYRLCPAGEPATRQARRAVLWAGAMAALIGSEDIERDTDSPDGGPAYLNRLIPHLVALLASDLPPLERAEAGRHLANLGDPRQAVTTLDQMEICYIPAGPFWMGSDEEDSEKPLHQVDIPYHYWLARYPVTAAQFRAFVETSGYKPRDKDSLRGVANHPVVNVTWHDALAFCRWLTQQWQAQGLLPDGWQVTLPSEAEWEKAARGGVDIPDRPFIYPVKAIDLTGFENLAGLITNPLPQRRYPWGDEADPNRANYNDTKIAASNTVGCFPDGASPYGCEEMSGNVWEWTRSLWGPWTGKEIKLEFSYPYTPTDGRENLEADDNILRVLRGGSFNLNLNFARCAVRFWLYPYLRNINYGFRVVVSPISPPPSAL